MKKRTAQNHLTIYRRHAPKACGLKEPRILDKCECPLWVHGKLQGKFIRTSLDTRSGPAGLIKVQDMLVAGWHPNNPTPGGGLQLMRGPKGEVTIEAASQDFLDSKKNHGTTTKSNYAGAVTHFRRWCAAQDVVLLKQIDLTHVKAYFEEYAEEWSRNTCGNHLKLLRIFFRHCIRERRWLDYSPAASKDLNKKYGNAPSRRLPFTPAEVTAILAAIEQMPEPDRARARALVLVLLFTGMRISDAAFLERSYIDAQNYLCYRCIKTRKELECSLELQSAVMAALQALPASRIYFFQEDREDYARAREALKSGQEFQRFCPGYQTRVQNATRLVRRVLRLAGIEGACHRFRDTFATSMLEAGADIFTVCQFLGHSDVKITQKHYIKWVPGYRERIAQRTRLLAYQFPLLPVSNA